jgi:TRAP-type C4-dicarboxylate transport system permease small subunit
MLDALYILSGVLSAGFIALICLVTSAQVLLNLIAKVLGPEYTYSIPSYADFAGFFLASASFLALAYTLTRGGHIRVTLMIQVFNPRLRLASEVFSLTFGALITGFATCYMIRLNIDSYTYGDLSFGIIAIPLWLPQLAVSAGLGILTIAFVDLTWQTLRAGAPVLKNSESE